MRINLIVPYSEHEIAKRRGARWDPARKVWYIENPDEHNLRMFLQWAPEKLKTRTSSEPLKRPAFKVVQPRTPRKKNWGRK
jgi:Domain of unknown function (DUF5710)